MNLHHATPQETMAALTAAVQEKVPDVFGVFVDGADTYFVYADRMERCQTPPEVTYALATHTSLVVEAGITLTFKPPAS